MCDDTIPNYPADLNAMHEAEGSLTGPLAHNRYVDQLRVVTDPVTCDDYSQSFLMATATAAQRAEAFLRTIGKWEDDQ